MAFDMSELELLGAALAKAGLPILAQLVSAVAPPPIGAIASVVIPAIGGALGLGADAQPAAIAAAVNSDPSGAADKLAAVQAANSSLLDFAKIQSDLDMKEAESANLFIAGWRPAFGWLGVTAAAYQMFAATAHLATIPPDAFNPIWVAFGGMLGLRTVEKWGGVARDVLKTVKGKK